VTERVERSGVDVEVALELDRGDDEPLVLQELRERGGEDALAEPGHHRAEDGDILVTALDVAVGDGGVELADVARGPYRGNHLGDAAAFRSVRFAWGCVRAIRGGHDVS